MIVTTALDPETGDVLYINGRKQVLRGPEATVQNVELTHLVEQGQWVLDRANVGLPRSLMLLAKGVDQANLRSVERDALARCTGVSEVIELGLEVTADGVVRFFPVLLDETGERLEGPEVAQAVVL